VAGLVVPGLGDGAAAGSIHETAAAVSRGVGIDDLAIEARLRDADAVIGERDGSEVAHHHQMVRVVARVADKSDDGMVGVVEINPLKARGIEIHFMQGAFGAVQVIQVSDQELKLAVRVILEQIPVEALMGVPFILLSELAAHEEHFLARMAVEEGVKRAEVGKLLPDVAGHLGQKRAFAVHHLVMREHQDEILGKSVKQ